MLYQDRPRTPFVQTTLLPPISSINKSQQLRCQLFLTIRVRIIKLFSVFYTSPIRRINIIVTTRQTTYYVVVDCIRQQLKIDGRGPSGSFSNHQLLVQEVAVVAQLRVSNLTLRQLAAKQSADRHSQRPINTHQHSNPRINSHRNVELCAYCCRLTARSSLGTRPIPQETPTPLNKAEHLNSTYKVVDISKRVSAN